MANSGYLCTCADAPAAPESVFQAWLRSPLQTAVLPLLPLSLQIHEMAFLEAEAWDLFRANLFSALWEFARSGRSSLGVLSMAPGLCSSRLGEAKVTKWSLPLLKSFWLLQERLYCSLKS